MKKIMSVILTLAMACTLLLGTTAEAKKVPVLNKQKVSIYVGKTTTLKVKNNKKKVTWKSSKKSVATVSKKGVVKGKKKGTCKITAKFAKKKLTCKITVVAPDTRNSLMVENFESYDNGYDWPVYTMGEGLTSGNSEPAHYLAAGETMKVVTDPENPANKLLQVKPKFYSFAPVLTLDLTTITGNPNAKLSDYSGIRCKVRVVSDSSTISGKQIAAFMGPKGTIDKRFAFLTYTRSTECLPSEIPYYIFYYTKAMATAVAGLSPDVSMPHVDTSTFKSTTGHKKSETAKACGFATRTLNFTKYLTDDVKNQSTFDMVLGASYGNPGSEYLAWYIDDIQLLY